MPTSALTVIHKYIRWELFDVSRRLSCAAPTELGAVRAAIGELAALLRVHAAQEDARLAPLLHEVDPVLAERMREDHVDHEHRLDGICAAAEALPPAPAEACAEALARLHLDWHRFVGAYLLHLDDEERTMLPALGARTPPLGMVAQSVVAMDEVAGRAFLEKLWAVVAPHERTAIEQALDRLRLAAASGVD